MNGTLQYLFWWRHRVQCSSMFWNRAFSSTERKSQREHKVFDRQPEPACKKKTQLEIGCARRVWGKRKGQEQAETYNYRGRTAIVLYGMATVFLWPNVHIEYIWTTNIPFDLSVRRGTWSEIHRRTSNLKVSLLAPLENSGRPKTPLPVQRQTTNSQPASGLSFKRYFLWYPHENTKLQFATLFTFCLLCWYLIR